MTRNFFDSAEPHTMVKMAIVGKCFDKWVNIIRNYTQNNKQNGKNTTQPEIAYIDLYSGRGRYEDGLESTPLIVLRNIIANENIVNITQTIFNDTKPRYIKELKSEINKLEGIKKLIHKPEFYTKNAEDWNSFCAGPINKKLKIFSFIDPWGFKGVSLELIKNLTENKFCDAIIFFNSNSIKRNINNKDANVLKSIDSIFTKENANSLRQLEDPSLDHILEIFLKTLNENGRLTQEFELETKKSLRYQVIYVTKNQRAINRMKEVMAKESSNKEEKVPSLTHSSKNSKKPPGLPLNPNFTILANKLYKKFRGRTIKCEEMRKICESDQGLRNDFKNFVESNYAEVLQILLDNQKIEVLETPKRWNGRITRDIIKRGKIKFQKGDQNGN